MKTKYLLISFVFAAFLSSSIPSGSHYLQIGKEAPSLTLSSDSKVKSLSGIDGKFVLINFWDPSDPASRIKNQHLSRISSSLPATKVMFISICTQSESNLANEILRIDKISDNTHVLFSSDISADVLEDFQVKSGNRSFLIDPYGNLVSIFPSDDEILSIAS